MAERIFRAAVVDSADRPISGVWQFLSHGDEIDISIVDIASQFKTSLHSSERYRLGFTTDKQSERFRASGLDKAIYKWRPLPLATDGARVPFQILIPAMGLGTNCNYRVEPDVHRLETPQGDEVLILSMIEVSSPGTIENVLESGAHALHQWSTVGGRHVCIATHVYIPTAAELNQWRALIASSNAFDVSRERCVDERGEYDPRGLCELDPSNGKCRVMEFGIRELALWTTFSAGGGR
ncbi:MAG: hypothetical protein ACREV5_20710 [Steroidobacter sp.]